MVISPSCWGASWELLDVFSLAGSTVPACAVIRMTGLSEKPNKDDGLYLVLGNITILLFIPTFTSDIVFKLHYRHSVFQSVFRVT